MKNSIVGRIDHTQCDHPDTRHAKAQCRAQKIAAAESGPLRHGRAKRSKPKAATATVPKPDPTTALQVDVLREVIESLDSVAEQLAAVGHLTGAAIQFTADEVPIRAVYTGGVWSLLVNGRS